MRAYAFNSTRRFWLLALLLGALAGLCLLPGADGGFIFDDRVNIAENTALHIDQLNTDTLRNAAFSFQPGNGSRPLPMLSFALDFWRGGLDPRTFKATNILIHVITTFALVLMLHQLLLIAGWPHGRSATGALLLAALWALHPLQISSVLYVVQRMQTLVTLFMVLALWAYLRMRQAQLSGQRSRHFALLMLLFWALGMASKEDAVLLPAYTLALELTVLRFRTAKPALTQILRRSYLALILLSAATFALWALPHYWHQDAYPFRNFSSAERVLTQGRVLVMYLGQILLPIPSNLPFYYDDFSVSRNGLTPPTTIPAWLVLTALFTWAWRWRTQHPLFAFGIFLFFSGHILTSNILNLELAFEHRNHLPLIGIIIATASLSLLTWKRFSFPNAIPVALLSLLLASEASATAWRAWTWGEPLRFAKETKNLAPHSERAWATLSAAYVDRSHFRPGSKWLDLAIATCEAGDRAANSALLASNAIIYKTIRGDASTADWTRLHAKVKDMPMTVQNKTIALTLLTNVERGVPLDENGVIKTWQLMSERTEFDPDVYLQMGAYVHNKTRTPALALLFLKRAVASSPPNDPAINTLFTQLRSVDREDWIPALQEVQRKARTQN